MKPQRSHKLARRHFMTINSSRPGAFCRCGWGHPISRGPRGGLGRERRGSRFCTHTCTRSLSSSASLHANDDEGTPFCCGGKIIGGRCVPHLRFWSVKHTRERERERVVASRFLSCSQSVFPARFENASHMSKPHARGHSLCGCDLRRADGNFPTPHGQTKCTSTKRPPRDKPIVAASSRMIRASKRVGCQQSYHHLLEPSSS